MARKRMHLGPAISRGRVGLGVILAKDSATELRNARIRRMIREIIPPAMRETTKETAAEIVVAVVDEDRLRAIRAEPLRNKTLRALMRSMVAEWLMMRIPTGQIQTDIQMRGHSSMRMHTGPQAAMTAGSLIAG